MSEISGIIRNGVERGWPIEEIRLSLFNSGYSTQEIDYELNIVAQASVSQNPPVVQELLAPAKKFNPQDLTNYQVPPVEKKASNALVIVIIILLILCILAGVGFFFFG